MFCSQVVKITVYSLQVTETHGLKKKDVAKNPLQKNGNILLAIVNSATGAPI